MNTPRTIKGDEMFSVVQSILLIVLSIMLIKTTIELKKQKSDANEIYQVAHSHDGNDGAWVIKKNIGSKSFHAVNILELKDGVNLKDFFK